LFIDDSISSGEEEAFEREEAENEKLMVREF